MKQVRPQEPSFPYRFAAAALVSWLGLGVLPGALGQAPAPDAAAPGNRPKVSTRKFSNLGSTPTARPSAPVTPPGAKPAASPSTPSPTPAGQPAKSAAADAAPAGPQKSTIEAIVGFLVAYAVWIVLAIALGLAALIYFTLRGTRPEKPDPAPEPRLPVRRPEEDEGPRRVLVTPGASAPKTAGAEDEKDYALVVKEEDLMMPPVPEEGGPRKKVDAAPIEDLISKQKFDDAYRQYVERIEADGRAEVSTAVERRLGSHFLEKGEMEKAARIFEHHVATHPSEEIEPQTYFDLAYIHFRGKTLAKSRRYFRLFVEREKDPARVDRAKKLLSRLEKVQNLN